MDKPQTARSYRATVLDDNAVVSINLKWLAQIGALLAMLVYGYWNMVTRITNLEQEVADADAQIQELVEKHILEEEVRFTEMEKQLKFYEKEFNINPLSWGRKKKKNRYHPQTNCYSHRIFLLQKTPKNTLKKVWYSSCTMWV